MRSSTACRCRTFPTAARRIGFDVRFRPLADIAYRLEHPAMDAWRRLAVSAALWSAAIAPSIAYACATVVARKPTQAEQMRRAQDVVAQATAIIDGVVIQPMQGDRPAVVRAERVLKGPHVATFNVGERTSCDLALTQEGEHLRLVLFGGPDVYFTNLDYSNALYEDRVLGSDRRKVWPYRQGFPPAR